MLRAMTLCLCNSVIMLCAAFADQPGFQNWQDAKRAGNATDSGDPDSAEKTGR